eukprot:TRINITY_DN93032_c0_g1_i1.p1 TRINITY_DN93032_c0_g1~~TRINITY_DN93032_c0_g1_i1.p1  ORF type:complete len:558 (+),score=54.32 TRINITY_DN93032_c0_g1_i1:32-1675(+)
MPRRALCVGIDRYAGCPSKVGYVACAGQVCDALRGMQYAAQLVTNCSLRRLKSKLRELHGAAIEHPGAVIVFYFAGQAAQCGGTNFLVPSDAQVQIAADIEDTCISLSWFLAGFAEATDCTIIALLEACGEFPFRRVWRSSSVSASTGLAPIRPPSCALVAMAAQPNEATPTIGTYAGEAGLPLFTRALVTHMTTPSATAEYVVERAIEATLAWTEGRQRPWRSSGSTNVVLCPFIPLRSSSSFRSSKPPSRTSSPHSECDTEQASRGAPSSQAAPSPPSSTTNSPRRSSTRSTTSNKSLAAKRIDFNPLQSLVVPTNPSPLPTPQQLALSSAVLSVVPNGRPPAFGSIQEALRRATPASVIHVYPGTYNWTGGDVHCSLIGMGGPSSVIVEGTRNGDFVTIRRYDRVVELQNITLRLASAAQGRFAAVRVTDASEVRIRNVAVEGKWRHGIGVAIDRSVSVFVQGCTVAAFAVGIQCTGNCAGCYIADNVVKQCQTGIEVDCSDVAIFNNAVRNSVVAAIHVSNSPAAICEDNIVDMPVLGPHSSV